MKNKENKNKKSSQKKPKNYSAVRKDMTLSEVAETYPVAVPVMLSYGLHCIGCHIAAWETVEQGAKSHGMTDEQVNQMIKEMNEQIIQFSRMKKSK